jgi:hypothetical protein
MKSFGWFVVGVVSGLVAGHKVANSPAGKAIIAELSEIGREFTDGLKEGYAEGQKPAAPASTPKSKA